MESRYLVGQSKPERCSHCIAVAYGKFVTPSIRRLIMQFAITYFSEISVCPWECTYASLGHTLMHAKRVFPPAPAAVLVDVDGVPTPSKASAPLMPDEAAFDPPTTNLGAASPDTPHAGNNRRDPSPEELKVS